MEIEQILSDLIKIPSVNPPGREIEVAYYLKSLFDKAGIENEIIESAPGRGNFIAYLGEGEKSLLFLSHSDVVPAGEDWDFEPFSGEIRGGMVLGRGALDCKGLVAAQAWAMLQLATVPLKGRLIFAATADEEGGGIFGVKFLLENFPQKLTADFCVTEGAEAPLKIGDKMVYFIQVGEKGVAWTKLKTKGISCHGSVPDLGENAIVKMTDAIKRLSQYKPQIRLIPEAKPFINLLAQQKGWTELKEEELDCFLETIEDKALVAYLKAITRMTVSVNVIQGGLRTNIVPDRCEAQVDIRLLPGQDKEFVLSELSPLLGPEVEMEILRFYPASFSPLSYGYKIIEGNIKELIGEVLCLPYVSPGATDSRYLRDRGINSYGLAIFSPDYDPRIRRTYHAKNERIDIKSLKLEAEFLKRLALTYLNF